MADKKKLHILQTIRQGKVGGGESHLVDLVTNLDKNYFDLTVLSFTDGPMVDRLRKVGIKCEVLYTETAFDIRVWRKVRQLLIKNNIDIVHAHGTRANSNVNWAARSLNIPVIYTIHGWSFHPDQNFLTKRLRILGEKYLTSNSDINISVSKANQLEGKSHFDFKSQVINYGIDGNKFNLNKTGGNIREQLGIPTDKFLFLFIARFTSHKQPLSLIKAYSKICHDRPNMHLLMVGDGDEKEYAINLINQLGLKSRVTLEKFRNDVPDILAAADIFVLPSLWEGLPIGLLEAMMMRKAIIASNVDGTGDIIVDGKNGILVNTSNLVDDLVDAMVKYYNNRELISAFGLEALNTVTCDYNVHDMAQKIEQVYKNIKLKSK